MALQKQNRLDQILTGLLIGIILPVIIFLITYQVKYSDLEFTVYLRKIWQMKIFLKILSLCVFPNLGVFLLFLWIKYERAARGVVMATFIYVFFVLIAKLI
ncbi:MAG: hypothetical protein Q8S54_06605 [Bacteroidota bacterium]|nr:hypothetical protein [Odoribacter sp.]MDP3642848.1 hypothetical protein [Bacteroidota bacterium]